LGDPALGNPANDYRNRIVLRCLGVPTPGATIVDVGSGQGQLAILLQETYPNSRVLGLEYSSEGVQRAKSASEAAGLTVKFLQRDLLEETPADQRLPESELASLAVCSEVLEHVDDPARLLRNASAYIAPGCRMVVTVPGGPRSALDRHIGHRRHFDAERIRGVLEQAGFHVERIERAGFPFFNLYRLLIVLRGQRLVQDLQAKDASSSRIQIALSRFFEKVFHWNIDDFVFGWQIVAVAKFEGGRSNH
jgi:SAM-dependent methyltransferase